MKAPIQVIVKYMPNTGRYLALIQGKDNLLWPTIVSKEEAQKLNPTIV